MRENKELSQGSNEMMILKILNSGDMYGYQIAKRMPALFDYAHEEGQGGLYPYLYKLERQKYLTSYSAFGDGRERYYYHLTDKGRFVVAEKESN